MANQSVIGVYPHMQSIEDAIQMLDQSGFPIKQLSVVSQHLQSEKQVQGFITTGDYALKGAGLGAWTGGIFGLLIGAAFLWVPGLGPLVIAGPLAAALLAGSEGAVLGATGGGALGALVGWGVSKRHVVKYIDKLRDGKLLLVVRGTPDEIERARVVLETTATDEVAVHGAQREPAHSRTAEHA
jgi:Heat induced stress protein YflT domain